MKSYVEAYLEEEIRAEALVKNVGHFYRFLELAGIESGNHISFRNISQEIGISHTTISSYFEILEDCLIAERIDPIVKSETRKKLIKSSRYLIFDLGVRRICANEGFHLNTRRKGELFEQYIGLELIRYGRLSSKGITLNFWRDADGPEVDWVLNRENEYIPMEVKWTSHPIPSDAKYLELFLDEYKNSKHGYIVCQTPRAFKVSKRVTALPWQEIESLVK